MPEPVEPGTRVELISTPDPYTHLKPGDRGTVDLIDGFGTIHVTWDDGTKLGLVPGTDSYEILRVGTP